MTRLHPYNGIPVSASGPLHLLFPLSKILFMQKNTLEGMLHLITVYCKCFEQCLARSRCSINAHRMHVLLDTHQLLSIRSQLKSLLLGKSFQVTIILSHHNFCNPCHYPHKNEFSIPCLLSGSPHNQRSSKRARFSLALFPEQNS